MHCRKPSPPLLPPQPPSPPNPRPQPLPPPKPQPHRHYNPQTLSPIHPNRAATSTPNPNPHPDPHLHPSPHPNPTVISPPTALPFGSSPLLLASSGAIQGGDVGYGGLVLLGWIRPRGGLHLRPPGRRRRRWGRGGEIGGDFETSRWPRCVRLDAGYLGFVERDWVLTCMEGMFG